MNRVKRVMLIFMAIAIFTFFNVIDDPAMAEGPYITWEYPKRMHELWRFFGHHTASFVYDCPFLAEQVALGLEIDTLEPAGPIRILPYLGNDRYLDAGFSSPGYSQNVAAAVIINHAGVVYSAALLFSNGLSVFVRNKNELPLAMKTFHDWANGIWQHAVWEPQTGPHFPTTVYVLKGYGDQSVN
jgi:hypothetical protein